MRVPFCLFQILKVEELEWMGREKVVSLILMGIINFYFGGPDDITVSALITELQLRTAAHDRKA
jgi:hypothetical protein